VGAVIVAVYGRTEIEAIITSFAAVPEGRLTASDCVFVAADDAARNVIPGAEADEAARNSGLSPFAALDALLNAGAAANTTPLAAISAAASAAPLNEVLEDFHANIDFLLRCLCYFRSADDRGAG